MAAWLIWIAVLFVSIVLVELLRLNRMLFRGLRYERTIRAGVPENPSSALPRVSVIIPAKDEEDNIEFSVRSILASEYPDFELILVDDRSKDRTLEIMNKLSRADSRISVLPVRELPEGWTGKTHALFQGARRASAEILLFTDADAWFSPAALPCALNYFMVHNLDMLSLLPGFVERGFRESAVYPHLALGFSFFFPFDQVNDEDRGVGMASGCFIMIRQSVYKEMGTWERLKKEITEDVALGKMVKAAGHRLNVIRGDELVRTRPFESMADVCRFWQRTFYGSLNKSLPKVLRLTANYAVLVLVLVMFLLSLGLMLAGTGSYAALVLFCVSGLATMAILVPACIFIGWTNQGSWLYGLATPVGLAISLKVALSTLYSVVSGRGIHWRGSLYH